MPLAKAVGIIALLASLATCVPLNARDEGATPFVGTGTINVIDPEATVVGCLTDTMQFTTTGACATFTGTQQKVCAGPPFGCIYASIFITITSDQGSCGTVFESGSQYEEGGNEVLSCGSAVATSSKQQFFTSNGFNSQIGLILLEDSDGSQAFNTIGGVAPGSGSDPLALQDDLGVGAQDGTSYALTWAPTS